MQLIQRLAFLIVLTHDVNGHFIAHCPEKFLKIQREHLDAVLLRRNQNLRFFRFLGNAGKRAGFDIVIATVGKQRFERLPCQRVQLNFIENNQRLPRIELCAVLHLNDIEKVVKIQQTVDEQIADRIVRRLEADRNAGLVFVPAEFLCNGRLADTACAFDKQRIFRRIFLFPFQHFRVSLALQNHFAH